MLLKCLATCTHTINGVEKSYTEGNQYEVGNKEAHLLLAFKDYFSDVDGSGLLDASAAVEDDDEEAEAAHVDVGGGLANNVPSSSVGVPARAGAASSAEAQANEGIVDDLNVNSPGGDRITVAELREIARGQGIDYTGITTKSQLLALLKVAGRPHSRTGLNEPDDEGNIAPSGDRNLNAELEEDDDVLASVNGEEPEDGEVEDLESMTVVELRALAESEGVDLTGLRLKDEIIAAIEEAEDEKAEPADEEEEV